MSKTFSLSPPKKKSLNKVPKLDFSTLKHNKEFKDWYKYATKLELSVKSLRKKIKTFETEMDECSKKNLQLRKQNSNLYALNKKLMLHTKSLKKKIVEIKDRYNKNKERRKFGLDTLEMTMPRFDTEITYDYSREDFPKEYLDDFNSNDSYEDPTTKKQISAYKNFNKSKTLIIDEGERRGYVQTEMVLGCNDSIEPDELTSGKSNKNSQKKSSKRIPGISKQAITDYQNTESDLGSKPEDSGIMRPNLGYRKKGLITKVRNSWRFFSQSINLKSSVSSIFPNLSI